MRDEAPFSLGERARRMGRRLSGELRDAGLPAAAASRVLEGYELAMAHRARLLEDEEHPGHLHPGRTVLILLRDTGEGDPEVLAAATVVDTWWREAEPSRGEVLRALGDGPAGVRDVVPRPPSGTGDEPSHPAGTEDDADALAEALVLADEPVRRLALAERLDHLRHLHLLGPSDGGTASRLRAEHQWACEVYLPLAARTDATLERRFRFWCRVFPRRLREWNPSGEAG